ncbi:Aldo/keto reductase [Klenkia soli]|uniref:Aldo/keto reductase n=1 Tax=Klenkia soli TaxID=1052260 RepID=A0A1H0FV80_9ACTN|nr:aldo/keto reductase [Klenkia soli]SDN98504.1 Aldo/keto reductase [Klenkia soli]
MPALGLGVGAIESEPGQAAASVEAGLRVGFRLVDTAAVYGNEAEVAEGIAASGVPRSEVFLTTKLWITDYGYDSALRAFDASVARLRTDHVDLYLLHQPLPTDFDTTVAAYRACERLLAEGRVGAIGICNASAAHLAALAERTTVTPAVNQVELHPYFAQPELRRVHAAAGIVTQAWSPIGGVSSWGPQGGSRPGPLADPVVLGIAAELGRTPAQVLLRWHLQRGDAAVTKSFRAERVRENHDVFGFELGPQHVTAIDALDTGVRGGRDPETVTR